MRTFLTLVISSLVALGCGDTESPTKPAPKPVPEVEPAEPGPLAEALAARAGASAEKIPEDVMALFERAAKELRDSGLAEKATNVGGKAPDFALEDPLGETVSLAALRKRGPVVVAFYRGKW